MEFIIIIMFACPDGVMAVFVLLELVVVVALVLLLVLMGLLVLEASNALVGVEAMFPVEVVGKSVTILELNNLRCILN